MLEVIANAMGMMPRDKIRFEGKVGPFGRRESEQKHAEVVKEKWVEVRP